MEEVELAETKDNYEIISVTPMRRLEERVKQIEESTTAAGVPQLQNLIAQIIELVKTNQKLIDEIVKADDRLRDELSKIPAKIEELVSAMKGFMDLIKMAGEEEVSFTPEAMKPIAEQFQKMVEQNQRLVESNQQVLESLGDISRKIRAGTPVSHLLTSYPRLKIKSLK